VSAVAKLIRLIAAGLSLVGSNAAAAQTVNVSGNPGLLRISTAIAGSEPIAVSNSGTTYTVTTGNPNRPHKIMARLSAPMPVGLTLTASLAAPPGATSLGPIALDAIDRDVVLDIPRRTTATQAITYALSATVAAGVIPNSSRTVTLTLVQQP
jgi:hypothetical protein